MLSVLMGIMVFAIGITAADSQLELEEFLNLNVNIRVDCVEDDPFIDDERTYNGSGFVIDSASDTIYVMTARHVLGLQDLMHADVDSPEIKSYRIQVEFPTGACRYATAFLMHRNHDIAILIVPISNLLAENEDYYPVRIDTTLTLDIGDEVYAIGHPYGQVYPSCTKGIIGAFPPSLYYSSDSTIASPLIQHDASVNPGSSGGPLVLIEDGSYSLVGMNIGTPDRGEMGGVGDIGYALNLCEVFKTSASVESDYIFVGYIPDSGLSLADAVDEAIDQLDRVGYEHMDQIVLIETVVLVTGLVYVWVEIIERVSDLITQL